MSVKIKTDYGTATVNNGRWAASNLFLRDLLTPYDLETLDEEIGYHPWPDLGLAELALEVLAGEIIETTDRPLMEAGVIY